MNGFRTNDTTPWIWRQWVSSARWIPPTTQTQFVPIRVTCPVHPSLHDLIALITSGEGHTKYYEGFVNKKTTNKWKDTEDLCEMDCSEVSQHRTTIPATSDSARLSSAAKQLGYCLQVKPSPAPRNLPQRTLRRGQCAAKRRCSTKSGVRGCGSSKLNEQVTTDLREFYILVET
jgi:hypothetical protein